MQQSEKKGIVLKLKSFNEGELFIEESSLLAWLRTVPANERGWRKFSVIINRSRSARTSHVIIPVKPNADINRKQ
jgi:hypothetical protein